MGLNWDDLGILGIQSRLLWGGGPSPSGFGIGTRVNKFLGIVSR